MVYVNNSDSRVGVFSRFSKAKSDMMDTYANAAGA